MNRLIIRTLMAAAFATVAAYADLPTTYRLALIQVSYGGYPAKYTKDQLTAAANEISNYYAQVSYGNFHLDVTVSSVTLGLFPPLPRPSDFFADEEFDATPIPSNEFVVQHMAEVARSFDHIDFSHIDGIAILNSFTAGDYMAGTVTIPSSSTVAGTYETAYLFEDPLNPSLSPQGPSGVFWAEWAQVIGEMIETRSGTVLGGGWDGSPGAGLSSYDLMDICWPCSPGAYSILGTSLMTGDKRVFNGWLPDREVVVDADDFTSRTFPLLPVTVTGPDCPGCVSDFHQVIKVPITPRVYYLVEARARTGVDALPNIFSRGGLWDEGMHITRVDEGNDPPVAAMNSCDSLIPEGCVKGLADPRWVSCIFAVGHTVETLPRYCWPYPLFQAGQTFVGEHGIRITLVTRSGNQFMVNVTRGPLFTAPDVAVLRRDTVSTGLGFNISGVPRHQLWIDSSCNGYVSETGAAGLRFGDPAQAHGLAVGDDLCLGHENRIYARIENRGTAPAAGVRVHFYVDDTATGAGFAEVAIADAQRFPGLASLAPGAQATVYVPYTPPAPAGGTRFTTPALMVRIDPLQGEISTGDNVAFSVFGRVQTTIGNSPDIPVQAPNFRYSNGPNPVTVLLNSIGNLPPGVAVSTGQTPGNITLTQGQQLDVPVRFTVSGRTHPAAGRYAANITLSGFVPSSNPFYPQQHGEFRTIAAYTVGLDVVEPSQMELKAVAQGDIGTMVQVSGRLQQPNRNKVLIALDYTDANQTPRTLLVETGGDGRFQAQLVTAPGSPVSALWAGDDVYAAAFAGPVIPARN